jgi:hypothetical protein
LFADEEIGFRFQEKNHPDNPEQAKYFTKEEEYDESGGATEVKVVGTFWFMLGIAIGFFLVFGVGARMRRRGKGPYSASSSNTIDVVDAVDPTPSPPVIPTPSSPTTSAPTVSMTESPTLQPTITLSPTIVLDEANLTLTDTINVNFFPKDQATGSLEMILPTDPATQVYTVQEQLVVPGDDCPPPSSVLILPDGNNTEESAKTTTVQLEGIDAIIAICVDNTVTGLSHYVFRTFDGVEDVGTQFEYGNLREYLTNRRGIYWCSPSVYFMD